MSLDKRAVPSGDKFQRKHFSDRLPFLPSLIAGLFRLLHRSCHISILGLEHEDAVKDFPGSKIVTCWHFAFPAVIYRYRDMDILTMVSRSRDGELAARVLKHLGVRCFRGSPGKGGSVALRALIENLESAIGGGFIADGSQGPARVAQKGILILARYTQAPILPVSMAASPCWRFRSWDRTVLAKPFSRIVMAFGPPIWVDREASSEKLEELRTALGDSLNKLSSDAENVLASAAGRV